MSRLVNIQAALKPFEKNRKKLKYIFMPILGLAESFKTMNRPGPTHFSQSILVGHFRTISIGPK